MLRLGPCHGSKADIASHRKRSGRSFPRSSASRRRIRACWRSRSVDGHCQPGWPACHGLGWPAGATEREQKESWLPSSTPRHYLRHELATPPQPPARPRAAFRPGPQSGRREPDRVPAETREKNLADAPKTSPKLIETFVIVLFFSGHCACGVFAARAPQPEMPLRLEKSADAMGSTYTVDLYGTDRIGMEACRRRGLRRGPADGRNAVQLSSRTAS